jgi:nickel/cobalt exporter
LGGGERSTWLILVSLPIALTLGAFHALSPGHGKTVVAAYLVGTRGTAWHALVLGVVVTLTHTAGVFALGFVVLFASGTIIPERLYPWLGFASGAMIFCVGAWQFVRRLSANYSTTPPLDPHGPGGHTHEIPERMSFAGLVALGVSGGIVPCPSALIVMLSAIALQRAAAGIVLIVAFSIGLASVLILIGMAAVMAQSWLRRFSWEASMTGRLRLMSSCVVAVLGAAIAIEALRAGSIL